MSYSKSKAILEDVCWHTVLLPLPYLGAIGVSLVSTSMPAGGRRLQCNLIPRLVDIAGLVDAAKVADYMSFLSVLLWVIPTFLA